MSHARWLEEEIHLGVACKKSQPSSELPGWPSSNHNQLYVR